MWSLRFGAVLALVIASCGGESDGGGDAAETGDDGGESTSGGSDDGGIDADGPTFTDLDGFQVLAVPLMDAGLEVPVADRPVPLIADRAVVLRAKVEVPAGWSAQEVELRVDVTLDGVTSTYGATTNVTGDSDPDDASSGLTVSIPMEGVRPGATYSAQLWREGQSVPSARFPATGALELAPVATGPIAIHIVPFEVDGRIPDTSSTVIDGFADAVRAYYPTTAVEITVGEVQPNPYPELPVDEVLGDSLFDVGVLMEQVDQAPPEVYYYGLMQPTATREEYGGITGTSQELDHRAGFAIGAGFGDALSESTLVHELGHLHFLAHAPCGSPENVDPRFPHADGMANAEGYDVRTQTFIDADEATDLMTYCHPRWVSAYHYAKMVTWVQTTQGW